MSQPQPRPDPAPAPRRDGLHCVYGTCRGMPCNPGCSFTMTAVDPMDAFRRMVEADNHGT